MIDWAKNIRDMLNVRYTNAKKVVLVMDNLNTHGIAFLYEAFPPEEALRLANRLEIHHTPKHGSWLNIAEIELSVLKRQCLPERIPNMDLMRRKITAWNNELNSKQAKVHWQFTTENARIKLTSAMTMLNPNTAGVDVGSEFHWVCVGVDRIEKNVRNFGAYTGELISMVEWLKKCRVTSLVNIYVLQTYLFDK